MICHILNMTGIIYPTCSLRYIIHDRCVYQCSSGVQLFTLLYYQGHIQGDSKGSWKLLFGRALILHDEVLVSIQMHFKA